LNPEIFSVIQKMSERFNFKEKRSCVNIPELNERFERVEKSLDVGEISKLMAEIYRYAYDHYLCVSLCEIPMSLPLTGGYPNGIWASAVMK